MLSRPARREVGEISPCPACGNRLFQMRFVKKGRIFWRCRSCGLEKQFPLPTSSDLRAYYDASYRAGMYKAFTDASDMKDLTAAYRLKRIAADCRPGRWLDVGCSSGAFITQARAHGIAAEGIDLSEVAVQEARRRGLPVFHATVEELDNKILYDTVTMFDVLEHVLDPLGFLQAVHQRTVPGGTVALTVPDHGSLARRVMGSRWFFYIPEEHLHYFNTATIAALLRRAGFEPIRCSSAGKPLTYRYSLVQFREYNPLIYRMLNTIARGLPSWALDIPVPLHIGELMVVALRTSGPARRYDGG